MRNTLIIVKVVWKQIPDPFKWIKTSTPQTVKPQNKTNTLKENRFTPYLAERIRAEDPEQSFCDYWSCSTMGPGYQTRSIQAAEMH